MSMLQAIRCRIGWHKWGPLSGDIGGAHHACRYCDKTKPVDTGKPPEAHDHYNIQH